MGILRKILEAFRSQVFSRQLLLAVITLYTVAAIGANSHSGGTSGAPGSGNRSEAPSAYEEFCAS